LQYIDVANLINTKSFLMKKIYAFLFIMSCTNLTTPYTQDFNSLDITTTASTNLPTGWSIFETGTNADQKYIGDNGGSNSGNTFSYGTTSTTERSLGGLQSGSLAPTFGVKFQNNSGATITSITVAYTGEQWRRGVINGVKDTLDFQYGINNADLATGPWTNVDALDFLTPNTAAAAGALDGNATANKTAISFTISSLNIAPGDFFFLRFVDKNIAGNDDGLGIDDMTVSFNGTALPPCVIPTVQPTAIGGTTTTTNSISFSITAPAPAPSNYLVLMVAGNVATTSSVPVNGTSYTVGTVIGAGATAGTVVYNGSGTAVTVNSLTAGSNYSFFIYSFNNVGCTGGPLYLTTTPLVANLATQNAPNCVAPTAVPTALLLTPTATSISGSFTASASANRYLVVRSNASTLTAAPVNGITYVAGATLGGGTVVQYGTATTFNTTGLTANTAYYYFVFAANSACTGEPVYLATSLNGTTTTLNNNPSGYYNAANGLNCQALKTALYNITSTGTTVLTYTPGVWNAYQTTDLTRNFENTRDIVWDMYSNKGIGINEPYEFVYQTNQCGNYSVEGDCYNREHSFPKSWFGDVPPMNTDIHHVVPTDGKVNNERGNLPFGKVGTANYTSQNGSKRGNSIYPGFTGTVFEPIDTFKGDFARIQLYMAVRYENLIAGWQNLSNANDVLNGTSYQVFDDWYLKMLYDWHVQDPVSAKEISRNNAVFAIQGNRNPFIDSPQYVLKIWNCTGLLSVSPPPTPVIMNVSNKCQNAANAFGKLVNPPTSGVAVTLDGVAVTYNTADSSFRYFTSNTTTVGNHTVRVVYTNSAGSSQKDSVYAVTAVVVPTVSIAGTTTLNVGQTSLFTATVTNGGATPIYQWQDSTSSITNWVNISGANSSTYTYGALLTGHKLRCNVTSTAACATPAFLTSNVLTFTVNTTTPVISVAANNFGIVLYPNPVATSIYLNNLKLTDKWQTAEIQTIDGKRNILNKRVDNVTNATININNLTSGVYVLVLRRANGQNAHIKFVKL
jgi:endonuclease I